MPTLRIRHLGKTITPEKVAVVRAQEYIKNDGLLIVPDLVSIYIISKIIYRFITSLIKQGFLYDVNYLALIRGNTVLLNKFMERIDKYVELYKCELGIY